MTMQLLRKAMRYGSAALMLAGLLGAASWASQTTTPPPKNPAAAAKPAAKVPAKPATTTGGAKTPTTAVSKPTTTSPHPVTPKPPVRPGPVIKPVVHPIPNPKPPITFHNGPKPNGSTDSTLPSGKEIRTRRDGRISDVHDAGRGMDVHRGLNGNRRISVERHDGSRLVAERGRRGYVQRGYPFHGHDFGRRSYYYHGREYNRYYRAYLYRGMNLNVYAPGFYYRPGFYGWAYNPWAAPIAFGWGWGGSPWYGYYGGYFAPYPVYPSASFWLTDYLISQDLQTAYAAHQEAGEVDGASSAAGGPPELTPDVKQQIAGEVRNQLALENQEAGQNAQNQDVDPGSSGIARLLADPRPHVFVVGGTLDLVTNGQECGVSDGDALVLRTPPPSNATTADLVVLASKGGHECPKSSTVTVQLTDLQEMQNHMRETIDQGLQDLQAKQGTGGLPPAPPSAQAPPTQTEYASIAPPPDPKDAADLQQQGQQADQVEKDVTAEAAQGSGGAASVATAAPDATAAPASVGMGQTPDQVQAALGAPASIAKLGPKVIYYYNGMKVTFKDGKVSDVE
ncbi:MAG: hypothetical protein WCD57_25875 [Acidobacteriaceae bacterium]